MIGLEGPYESAAIPQHRLLILNYPILCLPVLKYSIQLFDD